MDFRLSDETLEWKDYCRKFAREVIRPAAPEHDRDESVPYEVMKEAYSGTSPASTGSCRSRTTPRG